MGLGRGWRGRVGCDCGVCVCHGEASGHGESRRQSSSGRDACRGQPAADRWGSFALSAGFRGRAWARLAWAIPPLDRCVCRRHVGARNSLWLRRDAGRSLEVLSMWRLRLCRKGDFSGCLECKGRVIDCLDWEPSAACSGVRVSGWAGVCLVFSSCRCVGGAGALRWGL